jgi:hypothetical protein
MRATFAKPRAKQQAETVSVCSRRMPVAARVSGAEKPNSQLRVTLRQIRPP